MTGSPHAPATGSPLDAVAALTTLYDRVRRSPVPARPLTGSPLAARRMSLAARPGRRRVTPSPLAYPCMPKLWYTGVTGLPCPTPVAGPEKSQGQTQQRVMYKGGDLLARDGIHPWPALRCHVQGGAKGWGLHHAAACMVWVTVTVTVM